MLCQLVLATTTLVTVGAGVDVISSELNDVDGFNASRSPGGVEPVQSYCSIAQVGHEPIDGFGFYVWLFVDMTTHSG